MFSLKIPAAYKIRIPLKKGMRIGLMGGSFNPPHRGHVDAAKTALKALKLDRILWLVSPQNPLKTEKPLSSEQRIQLIQNLTAHPKFIPTAFEEEFGLKYTTQTLYFLRKRYPHVTFYFITGSDNIASMPKWNRWTELLNMCYWTIIARPDSFLKARFLKAYKTKTAYKKYYINHRLSDLSSSMLRNLQKNKKK